MKASWQARLVAFAIKRRIKPALGDMVDIARVRRVLGATTLPAPRGVRHASDTLAGVPGEWVRAEPGGAADPGAATLLYLHGGGFVGCSPRTHRPITAAFARQGFRVFVPDYRLAPEHPFPAAVDDAVAVWRALRAAVEPQRAEGAAPAARLVVAGDSAGGNLALALMLRLRDDGEPLPDAAALFSPATDLAGTGESIHTNSPRDAMFDGAALGNLAQAYLGATDPRTPLASPLYADLAELPPLLIHVGEREVLRDDSLRLAERARAAGVQVALEVWPVVPHVWQLVHRLPEARRSIAAAARFLHTARRAPLSEADRAAARSITEVDTLIIGAGFSGLAAAIRLDEAGMGDFLIVEKGDDVGGTWRDNHYPGAACDIPSHLYSLSDEPRDDWTRAYPRQPELLAYLRDVADRRGLRARMRLRCTVREAVWDERAARWTVATDDGATIRARVVISGAGALHWPAIPQLPGIERFEGRAFHSAQWDHDYDLSGKRVAVIGTGASAIQFVPEIAPQAARLHVFQRTPPWVVPKLDGPIAARQRRLMRAVPLARRAWRGVLFGLHEVRVLSFLRANAMTRAAEKVARAHLERQVPDAALRRKATPDYTLGCKRVLISNDWYPALMRSNVELVTDAIAEVRAHSIVTADGVERPVDAIVYGTGFETTESFRHMRIVGRGGVALSEAWRGGMQAYWGITVAGFPNWFMLLGPNTGLGHNSVVLMIEAQVRYVVDCLERMRARGVQAVDVKPQVQRRFNERLQQRLARTVWQAGNCRSWYQDAQGRNTTLWPGSVVTYRWGTRRARLEDYAPIAAGVGAAAL